MQKIYSQPWPDYELIDAGNGKKIERWGTITTIRPDVNAYFSPGLPEADWKQQAHFEFNESSKSAGNWQTLRDASPNDWQISFQQLTFNLHLTRFKHLGLFPEQRVNWDYIADNLSSGQRFLNLFAYTGAASLVARQTGAEVFHCDSVKQVISWARENMRSSKLTDIHWILEDALTFAHREVKRGKKYHGIIMDPPAFGLGANKKRWKIENKFAELLTAALALKEKNGFIIINTYSPRLTSSKIKQLAAALVDPKKLSVNDLCIQSTTGKRLEYGQRTLIR